MPRPASSADGATSPRALLARLGLSPKKRFGQNFLHDGNVARKIVSLAESFPPPYLEIGAGLGILTERLAAAGRSAVGVELDRGLAAHLKQRFEGSSVEIVEGDFLAVAAGEWRRRFPAGGTVVGNPPYSLSSAIVLRLIELRGIFPNAVLMLQKEVVERLCASPGGKEYGTLSVYLGALGQSRAQFTVRRSCFTPSPDVDSAVVSIAFRPGVSDDLVGALQKVVRAAFARRRKTLRNAPVSFLPGGSPEWLDLLDRAGIDPGARAETVPPDRYLALAALV